MSMSMHMSCLHTYTCPCVHRVHVYIYIYTYTHAYVCVKRVLARLKADKQTCSKLSWGLFSRVLCGLKIETFWG